MKKPEEPKSRDVKGGAKDSDGILDTIVAVLVVVLILVCLSFSLPTKASEHCEQWGNAAEAIMLQRQEHVESSVLQQRLSNTSDVPEAAKPTMGKIIDAAYTIPIYNKIGEKLQVIEEFSDAIFIECLHKTANNS